MTKLFTNFIRDERGDLTVEMAIIIASVVLISIAVLILIAPGFGEATGYSVNLLSLDREGNENPECRYVEGYQESPYYQDADGNILLTCTDLYKLQQQGVDIFDPDGPPPGSIVTN